MKNSTAPHNHPQQSLINPNVFKTDKTKKMMLDFEAFGRLRRELVWTVGPKKAQGILARFGVTCGQTDSLHQEGPLMLQGLGEIRSIPGLHGTNEYVFEISHSVEAMEHNLFFEADIYSSQCWLVAGYLTGVMSYQLGHPLYFLETHCVAKKDPRCLFVGKTRDAWVAEDGDLSLYNEDNMEMELSATQDQLRTTKDRYQNLFEQSLSPIFIIDSDTGVVLNANLVAEELTGYSREELMKMNAFDIYPTEEHNRVMEDMKSLTKGGRPADREISIVRKDGQKRIIAQSHKILSYGGQRVIQMVMRDVTDLKTSEQKEKDLQHQLIRSERLSTIGRLAAGVAHELKNPLGAIRNAIYYIRNSLHNNPILETDPHLKEILKLAEEEVDCSVIIIGELLDFSRVVQIVPRMTQINDVLEKLPSLVNVPESMQILWDLDMTLPRAMVDPDRLNQVFCNMASNAFQATPPGGFLKISTRLAVQSTEEGTGQQMIEISFEDNGIGIEPVHLSKIFEPLFTTKTRGTGLGLAISNNIIEKHGGVILVKSQVGKGTCFTIKLPLQQPPEKEELAHERTQDSFGG